MALRWTAFSPSGEAVHMLVLGAPWLSISAVESELHSNRTIDKSQVGLGQDSNSCAKTELAHCCYLVGHRFSRLAVQTDERLAGINPVCPARDGYDLNSVQGPV